MNKSIKNHLPYLVWFLGAFFFFIDYIVRVSPSVLTPVLMKTLNINAFAIGGFSACFYYAYISMQIPVGILVDKYSPKWLLISASILCTVSMVMFAGMNNITMGFISRFLTGIGASFAFVGTLKLISLWFAPERFAFLAGLTQAMGMLGAMIGQGPMALIYQYFGWRETMLAFCLLFMIIPLLMYILIKEKNNKINSTDIDKKLPLKLSIQSVLKNKQTWLNCLFIGFLYAPSACFGEQWGASFLSIIQNITIEAAGHETGIMFIGLAIGCPVLGWVSDKIQRRLVVMRLSTIMCFVLLNIVIYGKLMFGASWLNPSTYTIILFVYGFFNSGIVASYALASEINPHQLTGMALGVTNMASVIIGAIMIPIVGYILDARWSGVIINNIHVFSSSEYQYAFVALPLGFIVAFIITFLQKETYCKRI